MREGEGKGGRKGGRAPFGSAGRINAPQMAVNQQPAHNVFVLIKWPSDWLQIISQWNMNT